MGDRRTATSHVRAVAAPELSARVVRRVPMRYADGADVAHDRPAHVRAGSSLAWVGDRLAVIQDDANFVALVDPATGLAVARPLPPGEGGLRQFDDGRGNKAHKLDLEALASGRGARGGFLLALGSGSSPRRESVVLLERPADEHPATRLVHLPRFYALLRESGAFAGSELNVEGAVVVGDRLRLLNRGNGAPRDGRLPVDAVADVDLHAFLALVEDPEGAPLPALREVTSFALGAVRGTRLTFTDAALVPGAGARGVAVLYTATAEASPDAVRDGEVSGSAIGVLEWREGEVAARWAELRDADGGALAEKVEGLALDPSDPARLLVVVDVDAHDQPSELCEVRLAGPWPHLAAGPAAVRAAGG